MVKEKIEYIKGCLYQLDIELEDLKNPENSFRKGEIFMLAHNQDRVIGDCFISLEDGTLISLKIIKLMNRQGKKPVMIKATK